jgi:hypothetical protein
MKTGFEYEIVQDHTSETPNIVNRSKEPSDQMIEIPVFTGPVLALIDLFFKLVI